MEQFGQAKINFAYAFLWSLSTYHLKGSSLKSSFFDRATQATKLKTLQGGLKVTSQRFKRINHNLICKIFQEFVGRVTD